VRGHDASPSGPEFEDFLRRYTPALHRLVWAYVRTTADADDLFQEIAIALWKALPNFRQDCSERTYVYRVAHNTAISFVTSTKRHTQREREPEEHEQHFISSMNPEREAMENQQRQRLRSAVRDLSVTDRQIVLLYLEGLSTSEMEGVTGFTAGKIAMRLTRIRKRLAQQLGPVSAGETQ
jgi:RNA polymerase sigma-70 factor (ECF subfamily)